MNTPLNSIIKILLLSVLAIVLILSLFGLVLVLHWPWWVGIVLVFCFIGIGIGIVFLRKLLLRRKEQQFVQQVIDQDEDTIQKLAGKERDEHKELQDRWKEAVDTLKRSHLNKHGNPLYVLPWYLVMGESGSGKTTSIGSAKLSSSFKEMNSIPGISGTKNCDWWFFEQAIVIDTAGRYAIPVDDGKDKEEWQKFMTLLTKYRKKEPIHGLIVTVAADKLLNAESGTIHDDGLKIRRRIEELMRVLGIKFPVYVLVTKCDQIKGLSQFSEQLPEKSLDQPMGYLNQDLTRDVGTFLTQSFESIGERLRSLRLLMLHKPVNSGSPADILLFPEEFDALQKGLEQFVTAIFQENPYQETPVLRGLYFSSGRQEGTPYSHFLSSLGLLREKDVLPGTNKGLFLHDFFSKILPTDRGFFAPTKRAVEWELITRNLGLASWGFLGLALCGLLSFSFVKNLTTIREARDASQIFVKTLALKGNATSDLLTMDRYCQVILKVERQNRNWWIPRFGLNESIKMENGLKDKFCKQFRERFLEPFDQRMSGTVATYSVSTPDDIIGHTMIHLVRRINLLKARIEGVDKILGKPQPSYLINPAEQGLSSEEQKKFGFLYITYLLWRSDVNDLRNEVTSLQSILNRVQSIKNNGQQWVVDWTNKQGGISPYTLKTFWQGGSPLLDEISVAPAFTRKGKELIDAVLAEVISAQIDSSVMEKQLVPFERWYRDACFTTWKSFVYYFPRGVETVKGAKEWQKVAERMPGNEGPYFDLLNKLVNETEPLVSKGGKESIPLWLQQVYEFQVLKSKGPAGALVAKTAEEGKKLVDKLDQMVGKKTDVTALQESNSSVKSIQDYQAALNSISQGIKSRNQVLQLAQQVYSEDPGASKSPFFAAQDSLTRLRSNIAGGRVDEGVWRLISGPFQFLWTYTRMETGCSLQSQWEEKVLQEAQGVTTQDGMQYLLSPDGPVWKFVKGPAAPFMGWSPGRGYYAKDALGGAVPIDSGFYSFLTKGAKAKASMAVKQSYSVTIKGLPTDANSEARFKPQSTKLELQCAQGNQMLENLNFPTQKVFNWAPESCSDVSFQIEVGNVVLSKRYSGPQAFPTFLQEFKGGRRTFTPGDFPQEKSALTNLGIKYIKVNYHFSGDQAISGQASSIPGQLPKRISRCWD